MEPIISPWIIYFMGYGNMVRVGSIITITCGIIAAVVFIILWIISDMDSREYHRDANGQIPERFRERTHFYFKMFRNSIISILVGVLLIGVVPTEERIWKMVAASTLTSDNISATISAGKDIKNELKNDIIELIRTIKEPSPGDNK